MNARRGGLRQVLGTMLALTAALAATTILAAPLDEAFKAASIDDLRDVRRLVQDRVVDPNALGPRGDTLLIAAIRDDAARVTDYLVGEKSTDLNATNVAGETAMMIAAFLKKKGVVDNLIARDAEVNRPGWTALHYAASVGAADIVGVLLEHSAYVDAESPNRTTPLMMAARGNYAEVCRQLIDAGADPTPVNQSSLSAADYARRASNGELGQWLDTQVVAWRAKYGSAAGRTPPPR